MMKMTRTFYLIYLLEMDLQCEVNIAAITLQDKSLVLQIAHVM